VSYSPSCRSYNLARAPRAFFECGNSPLGFDDVGAPTFASALLLSPPGGAESLAGSSLLEFSGFKDVGSPSCGVFVSEFMASLVLGLSSVPRTVFECGLELIVVLRGVFWDIRCFRIECESCEDCSWW
jgi:hypothetical protein